MILRQLIIFLLTYWLASDVLCLLVLRVWEPQDVAAERDVFFLTRGLGPIVISWLLYHLFLLFPEKMPSTYVSLVAVFFAVVLVLGRQQVRRLGRIYAGLAAGLRRHWPLPPLSSALLCLVTGIALFIAVIGVAFPIVEGDALGFGVESRLIYRDLSFAHYPTLSADPQTGYYYDTFQVPCLQMLYVWFDLLEGTSKNDILARTVAPVYALEGVLLLGWVLWRRSRDIQTALWGGLALIATPLFASESYFNTQDPHRFYFAFASLVMLAACVGWEARRHVPLLGITLGLTIYCHFMGLLTLAAVVLLYLWLAHGSVALRFLRASLIVVVALLVGATYHYARPAVAQRVLLQFPILAPPVNGLLTHLHLGNVPAQKILADAAQAGAWLTARRGQQGWFGQFVFGKLQAFTGIEWFGAAFWLFVPAMAWWTRCGKTTLEKVMGGTALIFALVVLSDIRDLASSNPRYIGTLLPITAYFDALLIAAALRAVGSRFSGWAYRATALAAVAALAAPLAATTAVRGAKVGITNPGNLLERIHSGTWIGPAVRHPAQAAWAVWTRYFGIKATLSYLWASDEVKLGHTNDLFATIAYMRSATPREACALVFRVTPFFYYAQRRGVSFLDPRIDDFAPIREPQKACSFLAAIGVDHVLMDSYYTTHPLYTDTALKAILADPQLSTKVYEYGSAQVYKLQCTPESEKGESA